MFFFIFSFAFASEFKMIPSTGPPPSRRFGTTSVFDSETNQIIYFGGLDSLDNTYELEIHTFSLTTYTWGEIIPESLISLKGFTEACSYLRSDRVVLIFFGKSQARVMSDVLSFNLATNSWKVESLSGDPILGRIGQSCDFFEYLDEKYAAIFGGLTYTGQTNQLFMINLSTLETKLLPNNGNSPGATAGGSLVFYDGCLYMVGYMIYIQNDERFLNLYKYDLLTQQWEIVEVQGERPEKRAYHKAFVINDEMFLAYGITTESAFFQRNVWKFNFSAQEWLSVSNIATDLLSTSALAVIGTKAYFSFGSKGNYLENSVFYLDLSEANPTQKYLSYTWDSPIKRKNHCSILLRDHMYIFGGVTSGNVHLNDIWYFDLTNYKWNYVVASGDIPKQRQLMGCDATTDINFVLFGGTDMDLVYNDLYSYNVETQQWKLQIIASGSVPSPRYSSCLLYYKYNTFILGGRNDMEILSEIWMYERITSSYKLINSEDSVKINLAGFKCWIDEDQDLSFYTISGHNIYTEPSYAIYKIKVSITELKIYTETALYYQYQFPIPSFSALVHSGDYAYLLFGSYWDSVISPFVVCFNFKLKIEEFGIFDPEMLIYGHTAVHYKDSIYIFGGGKGTDVIQMGETLSNNLYKLTRSDTVFNNLKCSIGTISPDCTTCEQGFYANNGTCSPCPTGRYSKSIASSSIVSCTPCAFGNYNPIQGSYNCMNCPFGSYCPIGSSVVTRRSEISEYQSVQPLDYSTQTVHVSNINSTLWYSFGAIIAIVAFISIVSQKAQKKIKFFDLYVNQHTQKLNIPVIYKKTKIGGFFSIIFILSAIVTISGSILTYQLDNVNESKSLVPVLLLDSKVTADLLEIQISFYTYLPTCAEESKCVENNKFLESGFGFSSRSVSCEKEGNVCRIFMKYFGFTISSASTVKVQMTELLASATAITVNLTCSSSIPNEKSSVFIPITTDSDFELFIGVVPTVVKYEFTPSAFKSKSSQWSSSETGYHVAVDKDVSKGSQNTVETINSDPFLLVTLNFFVSSTGLVTHRTLNNTILMFSGALLGAIFGLMGTIASVMILIEGITDKAHEKYRKKVNVDALKRFTREYFELYRPEIIDSDAKFTSDNATCNTAKVFPLDTTISARNI